MPFCGVVTLNPATDVGAVASAMRKWVGAHAAVETDVPVDAGVLTSFELAAKGFYRARSFDVGATSVLGHMPAGYDPVALVDALDAERPVLDYLPDTEFAVVVWQPEQRRLVLVRDLTGSRALYYVHEPGAWVAFASVPEPLLEIDGVRDAIDETMLPSILVLGINPPREATFFARLRRVPAAHRVSFDPNRRATECVWRLTGRPRRRPDDSVPAQLRSLLSSSVARRMHGATRVAAELSGGLDSSAVAALAYAARGPGQRLSLVRFDQRDETGALEDPEEAELALALSERLLDAELHDARQDRGDAPIVLVEKEFLERPLPELVAVRAPDERLFRIAVDLGCERIFTGWGGDEMASHRTSDYALAMLTERRWLALARTIRAAGLKLGLKGLLWDQWRVQRSGDRLVEPDELATVASLFDGGPLASTVAKFDGVLPRPAVRARRRLLLTLSLFQLSMEAFDWIAQQTGIEVAHPLQDRALLEYCDVFPIEWVSIHGEPRRAFREATADLLPAAATARRKSRLPHEASGVEWYRRYYGYVESELDELMQKGTWLDRYVDLPRLRSLVNSQDDSDEHGFVRQIAMNALVVARV